MEPVVPEKRGHLDPESWLGVATGHRGFLTEHSTAEGLSREPWRRQWLGRPSVRWEALQAQAWGEDTPAAITHLQMCWTTSQRLLLSCPQASVSPRLGVIGSSCVSLPLSLPLCFRPPPPCDSKLTLCECVCVCVSLCVPVCDRSFGCMHTSSEAMQPTHPRLVSGIGGGECDTCLSNVFRDLPCTWARRILGACTRLLSISYRCDFHSACVQGL